MKTKLILSIVLIISLFSFAQNGINYKALIKDDSGNVVANQSISIQFIILEDATSVYQETHNPATDDNGIVIVNIGEGTPISGDFSTIDWGSNQHFLNVQVDIGSGLVDMGTTEFKAVPFAKNADTANNVSGLEAINESNGIGWRLLNRNNANYGDIGQNAIDFSLSSSSSTSRGATGITSMAAGFHSTASGADAIALGLFTTASGNSSFSTGAGTIASGLVSVAMGSTTTARSAYETAIGRFTTNELPLDSINWNTNDRLFVVGNGTSNGNRSNALTVLKNGTITAPSLTNALIETAGDKALVTKEYVEQANSGAVFRCRFSEERTLISQFDDPLIFDNQNFNFGGGVFDATEGSYTVPSPGVYSITINLTIDMGTANSMAINTIVRNSSGGLTGPTNQISPVYSANFPNQYSYTILLNCGADSVISTSVSSYFSATTTQPKLLLGSNLSIHKVY